MASEIKPVLSIKRMEVKLNHLNTNLGLYKSNMAGAEENKKTNFETLIAETEREIAELEEKLIEAENKSDIISPQTMHRQAVLMTGALKNLDKFDVSGTTCTVENWCEEVEKMEKIHANGQNAEKVQEFYNQICGLLDTCTYDQWNADQTCDKTITGLMSYIRLNFGDRTSIYQMLHSIWSMEKSPTKNFKQTAAEMQHQFTKVMKTVKVTYKKSTNKDLDLDAFSDIVCGMIFCDLARKADPQTFKLATRDMDEKFTAGEIAATLKLYIDRNGETDNVTKATTNDVFYGTAPRHANKGKNGKNGNKRGNRGNHGRDGGNSGGDGGNHGHSKNDKSGANNGNRNSNSTSKNGIPDGICPYQYKKNGCYRKNCNLKHGFTATYGGPRMANGQPSTVNASMHATNGTTTPMVQPHSTIMPSYPTTMSPSPMIASQMTQPMSHSMPQHLNSHFMNHTTTVTDPDFQMC